MNPPDLWVSTFASFILPPFFFCSDLKKILASFCFTLNTFVCILPPKKSDIFLHNHNTIITPNKINNSLISSNITHYINIINSNLPSWHIQIKIQTICMFCICSFCLWSSFILEHFTLFPPFSHATDCLKKLGQSSHILDLSFASSWYCLTYSSLFPIIWIKYREQNRCRLNYFGG